MGFVHLHVHTEYSLLDGACRIEELLDAVQAMGQQAVACTDHGVMYGVIDFYNAAKKRGIKPIIGCEVYVAKRTRFDRVHELDSENRHLVLLCENQTGYQNLMALVSKSWMEGFYNKPRVDFELLEKYHEGLIATSACLAGEIPRALTRNDYEGAKAAALNYQRIFGKDNFFLELQDHGLQEQYYVNPKIIKIHKETGIPLVVTNDCHYIKKEDNKMHHVLMCIQTGRTVEEKGGMEFGSEEFYVKSEKEMRALFPDYPQAADNTVEIARRCCVELEFGITKLPRFDTPDGSPSEEFFSRLCQEGIRRRYGESPSEEIMERLRYEMDTISRMGYVNYYLIVWDFIRYAKSVGIPVGPGRGSGAGSLVAYAIGITGIDPIENSLIFERFLNPERVSMPDFDIDFSDERRPEMIDYVVQRYGADHVAQIVTFGTMAARGALRDVGRALDIPYAKVDRIAKLVPMRPALTLQEILFPKNKEAQRLTAEFRQLYESDSQLKELVDMSRKVEGMPRHASTHAAGVLITDAPVMEYVPLAKNDESVVTQYTMNAVADLGLLKMDFLGLRNLSVLDHAEKMIREQEPAFSVEGIDLHDEKTYAMLSQGFTEGVFQFESGGMRRLTMQAGSSSLEDLTAVVSLYRPGPMQFIPTYLKNRRNPEAIRYRHPRLRKILEVTSGCIIYQEQVMEIFRELAGYSLGRADIVRRAMSKKKRDVLERERQVFIYGQKGEDGAWEVEGCINRGVEEAVAQELFREIESFASYAFNKSHAAAYALVAYETAYLKCHYPREYMAALLSSVLGMEGKVAEYMEECHRLGIDVLPPHVNYSNMGFTPVGNNIRFGLLAVKNMGRGVILRLIQEREQNGPYRSFYDFCKRNVGREMNRRTLESLIKCGALDELGNNRREMLLGAESVLSGLEYEKRNNIEGQIGLFDEGVQETGGEPELERAADFSSGEKMAMEKESTGMYLSGHPMAVYRELYERGNYARIDEILLSAREESPRYSDNQRVKLLVTLESVRRKETKKGDTMAFLLGEDMYGSMECLVFPKTLEQYEMLLRPGEVVFLSGRLSFQEEKEPQLVLESAEAPEQASSSETQGRQGLYLKLPSREDPRYKKAMQYVEIFDGEKDLYLLFQDTGKVLRAPQKYRVDVNKPLLKALKKLLGEENVAFRGELR